MYTLRGSKLYLTDLTNGAMFVRKESISGVDWYVFAANFKNDIVLRVRIPVRESQFEGEIIKSDTIVEKLVWDKEKRLPIVTSFIQEAYQLTSDANLKYILEQQLE
jgi:hypothetical protein